MARLDPGEGFDLLKDRVTTEVKAAFPQEGNTHVLDVESVDIEDDLDPEDIEGQKKSKLSGTTWGVPVKATMVLKDKASGKVVNRSKLKVATLPKHTRRHSYIVGGTEYQVDNQWRLKPGIYTRVAQNGQLESRFNFQGKMNLDMLFDPKSKKFQIKHGGSKPPLYPILKAIGVDDDTLQKTWGKEILNANKITARGKPVNVEKLAVNFAKRLNPKADVKGFDDAGDVIREYIGTAELRPDVTKLTLGKEFKTITPEAMTLTSRRLLGVARGDKPDVRDALQFKDLLSTEDFIAERMRQGAKTIARRIHNNIDRRETVREIVGPDVFDRPIKEFFTKTSLANTPQQVNPLEMLSGQQRTTITGEGGVKSSHKIQEDAKLVDPSHFGVLDPLHTPECFDRDTEVFTRSGWVSWSEITDDAEFACNVDGGLEFHKAERIVREHYKGVMYGARTKIFSYLVTPNHRMWCRARDDQAPQLYRWHFETAEEMSGKTRDVDTGITNEDPISSPCVAGSGVSVNLDSTDHFTEQYDGMVYCATVPGGLLYTRRHGKTPFWSGNSDKTGVTLHMAMSAVKKGTKPVVPLHNVKTGKIEYVDPNQVSDSIVAMPDEGSWKNGKWVPGGKRVKASTKNNEIMDVDAGKVQYVMQNPGQMFSVATNMVPFLSCDSPNRSSMAGKQMEQAISLKHREAPLVQVSRGDGTKRTYEEFVGRYSSHEAPMDGKVTEVTKSHIMVQSGKEKKKVQLYDNYPLNDKKGLLHSTPKVKVGDAIKKGQVVADSNFTKDGVYAPGVNLEIGYTPWKGYNFEDGVVISETAAKKLTSEHLHKMSLSTKQAQVPGLDTFMSHFSSKIDKDQLEKLDTDGIAKTGVKVRKGDTLIAAVSESAPTTENQMLKNLHRSLVRPFEDRRVTWDQDIDGEVVGVTKKGKKIQVHVRTDEPMTVGDKMVGRHGNKGIVTRILPDAEMPATKEGKKLEVLMNPIGIAGRMNIGQVLETAASKVAEKRGRPLKITNFGVKDSRTEVENLLKRHGVSDRETIVDPKDGTEIEGIQVGKQYILKLQHQVDKKMSARSRAGYDRNLIPKGGGKHGAQALGALGMYAMLAHGAKHNIREMQTLKSDKAQNDELWDAIQTGEPLPPPKTTFGYQKFESYLKGMGVNTVKDGNSLTLVPMTDNQVEEMSSGELKDAGRAVRGYKIGSKERGRLNPEKSGLFDSNITGGLDGDRWSHISLSEPTPNPLFEKAVRSLTGIRGPQFQKLIKGEEGVDKSGQIVPVGTKGALYGPQSVGRLLDKVDIDKDIKSLEEKLPKIKLENRQPLNEARRKIKYLKALKKVGLSPREAYMTTKVPVLPPAMRPLSMLEDGALQFDDLNQLYKDVALLDGQLKEMPKYAPDSAKAESRADIYDRLSALTGVTSSLKGRYQGIAEIIAGDKPKYGYAQDKLIKRKMDLSARSTIVPEPSLSLDEVALPRKAAMEIYKPFIVRELRMSTGSGPLTAKAMVEDNHPAARDALERVVEDRPVLMKRDPVLHKYGVQAFKPKIVEGRAIKIHPLVCSGFNADFDGDTMSATVPITEEAVDEARKMYPSKMLFNPATHGVMYTPAHETQVGLYMSTDVKKKTNYQFKNQEALQRAVREKKLGPNDAARVGKITTTLDRMKLDDTLPSKLRGGRLLTDLDYRFTKKDQSKFFKQMADADPKGYSSNIDKMKDVGNIKVTHGGFSFGLSDFKVHTDIREPILREADRRTAGLDLHKKGDMEKFVSVYEGAMDKLKTKLKTRVAERSTKDSLAMLETAAGIKGKGYAQLTTAPVLFVDAKGDVVASPVRRSYSEGLSSSDYWASVSGGRKGIIQRTQSTAKPGYLTKLMMNSVMNTLVQEEDCGTDRGISLNIDEPDLIGRYTTASTKIGGTTVKEGTLVTTDLVNKAKNAKVSRMVTRSPMRCNNAHGVCAKCAGLNELGQHHSLGTNIGVLSAQAIGERGTQLAMKAFHCNHAKSLVYAKIDDQTSVLPMEELFRMFEEEAEWGDQEQLIDISDQNVMVWDGSWVAVTAIRRHVPDRPMVMVSDGSCTTICQDNHPVAVGEEDVWFTAAGSLEKDEHTLIRDLSWVPGGDESRALDLDPYFVGAYVAEGWIGYRWTNPNNRVKKPYSIGLKQNHGVIRDKIIESAPQGFNVSGQGKTVEIHSLDLGRMFESLFGRYSRNVSLPPEFVHYPDSWLRLFLCGLIDGDGTIKPGHNAPPQVCVDTTSYALVQQLVIICSRLGIVTNVQVTPWRKHSLNQGFRVVLRVTRSVLDQLEESIKLRNFGHRFSPDQDVELSGRIPTRKVRTVTYTNKFVYDLTTESSQLVVGGLLSHNSGGVHEGRSTQSQSITGGGFDRAVTLLSLPEKVKGSAKLATTSGKVESVNKDPAGGYNVKIGGQSHYVPADRLLLTTLKKGATVKKGDPITRGPVNPRELLPLTNMNRVQGFMASELHSLYAPEGIRRRNSEVIVRSLSNVTKVEDAGDNGTWIRGDFAPTSVVNEWNRKNAKRGQQPVKHAPVLRGVKTLPEDVQTDWLARLNHENIRATLIEGAQQGWSSNLHGDHPIPPMIYGAEFGKGTKDKPWSY